MKHPHSTCPVEPSVILAPFLLLFALICYCWRNSGRLDYVMVPGKGRVECK